MLICEKIKRTMGSAGQVIVESHGRIYVSIRSETAVQSLVSMARVKESESFKFLWVSEDFYIGDCRVMAGIRRKGSLLRLVLCDFRFSHGERPNVLSKPQGS